MTEREFMESTTEKKKCYVCEKAHNYFIETISSESISNDIIKRFSLIHHDSRIQGEAKMFAFAKNIGNDYPKQIWQPVLNGIIDVMKYE